MLFVEQVFLIHHNPVNVNNVVSNYTVGSYLTTSKKNEQISKESIQYIDPVPLGVTDESAYKKVVTTQNYEYGALRGLPTKITSTTSQSGVINEIRNFYVNQATNPNYHNNKISLLNLFLKLHNIANLYCKFYLKSLFLFLYIFRLLPKLPNHLHQ